MAQGDGQDERALVRKIAWRTLPLILLSYFIAFVDRANISFAASAMNADLGFSEAVYGIGASAFFIGYALFEVPSNLALARFGARRWLARIMLTWGLISAATAFIHGPWQFYIMRFLLGVAEAGFYPGVILYLSGWFPGEHPRLGGEPVLHRAAAGVHCHGDPQLRRCWRWMAGWDCAAGSGC